MRSLLHTHIPRDTDIQADTQTYSHELTLATTFGGFRGGKHLDWVSLLGSVQEAKGNFSEYLYKYNTRGMCSQCTATFPGTVLW